MLFQTKSIEIAYLITLWKSMYIWFDILISKVIYLFNGYQAQLLEKQTRSVLSYICIFNIVSSVKSEL